MLPLDIIIGFEKQALSTFDYDWEAVLETGYRRFLTPDSCVLDIGGHDGRHSDVFIDALQCRNVVIFEPLPEKFQYLKQRYQKNNRVRLFPYALSGFSGKTDFTVNIAAPEESGLKERVYNDPNKKNLQTISVDVRKLDEIELPINQLDYIKIDTEGAEIDIIKGAQQTLRQYRPILSVEYGLSSYTAYGHTRTSLFELADNIGYTLCDLFGNPFDAEQWDNVVDRFYWDYYLVPDERVNEFHHTLWDGVFENFDNCRFNPAENAAIDSKALTHPPTAVLQRLYHTLRNYFQK